MGNLGAQRTVAYSHDRLRRAPLITACVLVVFAAAALRLADDSTTPAVAAVGDPAVLHVVDTTGEEGGASVQVQGPGAAAQTCDEGFYHQLGERCDYDVRQGDVVTLTAVPIAPVTFKGWSDDRCPARPVCSLTLADAQTVVAFFSPVSVTLGPINGVFGTATVTITDSAGHACSALDNATPRTCTFDLFASLTLVATTDEVANRPVWSTGDCTPVPDSVELTETCTATLLGAQSFNVGFGAGAPPIENAPPKVDVVFRARRTGTGAGTIRGDLDCGPRCSVTKRFREPVTLVADPSAGSRFVRWTGGCGTAATCRLQAIATSVSAEFETLPDSVSRGGASSLNVPLGGPFKALVGTIVTVSSRGRRQILIPIGVSAPARVRMKLLKRDRNVKSRLFSLRAGVSLISLGVPQGASAGRYKIKLTIRDRKGSAPVRIARRLPLPR